MRFRDFRYTCDHAFEASVNGRTLPASLKNISQSGAAIAVEQRLRVGDNVVLPLRRPFLNARVTAIRGTNIALKFSPRLSQSELAVLRTLLGAKRAAFRELV